MPESKRPKSNSSRARKERAGRAATRGAKGARVLATRSAKAGRALASRSAKAGRALASRSAKAGRALASDRRLARAREALRAAAQLYMRVAERAGRIVLAAWLVVWPQLLALLRLARRLLRWGERELTPRRVTIATAALVALFLAASQFADYTATRIGAEAYQGVEDIAPAPEMRTSSAGSAHAWLGLPIAAAALLAIAACARGRRAGAAALVVLGLATVALSLLVDMPKGLDEGEAAIAYEDAKATLESGFWVQLVCGALLVALAPLLAARAGGERAERRARRGSARRAFAERAPRRRRKAVEKSEGGETAPGEPLPEG